MKTALPRSHGTKYIFKCWSILSPSQTSPQLVWIFQSWLRRLLINMKIRLLFLESIALVGILSEGVNHACIMVRHSCNANLRSISHFSIPCIYVRHLVDITVLSVRTGHLPGDGNQTKISSEGDAQGLFIEPIKNRIMRRLPWWENVKIFGFYNYVPPPRSDSGRDPDTR